MIFKHPSILRNLLLSFLVLGLGMGSVFPVYAKFFVEWKPGMFTWFVVGCLVAGATIGLANYAVVKLVLLDKLKRISAVAHAISEKDISLKCEMQSKDVVGEIIDSFNAMASNLREIITQINDQAAQVSHSTDELHQITLDMSSAASRQYSETDQVATAINEMTATVQEVSRHASETAMSTSEADAQGVKAKQVIGNARAAVEALANNVSVANGVILRLQQESRNIGSVLSVISGIAEQTNLLALNAAIEAARAGEQGRGFAVVADEVRGLANRTQESTREISDMIDRLQKETGSAVHAMEQGSQQALKGVELSNDAAAALDDVVRAINQINEMNIQIAGAAKEQSIVADEINRNIINVNEIVSQSLQGVERATANSSVLSDMASQMKAMVSSFRL